MVNETISYDSPDKIKSIMHYIKTDHEAKITPVGVYSSLGKVDYFAFQRSTKTFKIDFLEPLSKGMNNKNEMNSLTPERKSRKMPFRYDNENEKGKIDMENESSVDKDSEINFIEKSTKVKEEDDKNKKHKNKNNKICNITLGDDVFDKNGEIDKRKLAKVRASKGCNVTALPNTHYDPVNDNTYFNINDTILPADLDKRKASKAENTNPKAKNKLKNSFTNPKNIEKEKKTIKMNTKNQNKFKSSESATLDTEESASLGSNTNLNKPSDQSNPSTQNQDDPSQTQDPNNNLIQSDGKLVDFNLEYIYDAKHLVHSVSDFRSTPDFNNITFNFDRFYWNLKNENFDKSDQLLKIEFFFDMEESFYNENIFLNLNFNKTILILNQTERGALENTYTKLDTNLMTEFSTYNYDPVTNTVSLNEKEMTQSSELDKMHYYVKNKHSKNKNELLKIMKVEAVKVLKYNESFQLEIRFPLYFENCRNYKTNTMIMVTGIVLMVFLGSILYLIVSLNFSDKD